MHRGEGGYHDRTQGFVSFRERFVDVPLEAVGNTTAFQTWARLVGVADRGGQAALRSTLAMADYRTYLNLVRGVGQASAWANWVVLGPGALESRSPTLAHPFQSWNNFKKREAQGVAGTYLDAKLWKDNFFAALDSLAMKTGAALPQGVLLAYGLAPQVAAFEAQNVAWGQSALRAVDRGFEKMVPPPSAMTPEGFAMPVAISEEGASVTAAAVPGSAGVLAGGPLAGMVNPYTLSGTGGPDGTPSPLTYDTELRRAKDYIQASLGIISEKWGLFVVRRQIAALKNLSAYVEQEARIAPTADIGKAWVDAAKEIGEQILSPVPRVQDALQAGFDRVVALPDSELGAYDLLIPPPPFGTPFMAEDPYLVRRTPAIVESN